MRERVTNETCFFIVIFVVCARNGRGGKPPGVSASEEELDALQDENVRRMAAGSRVNYAAGWSALNDQHPEVVGGDDTRPE